MTTFPSGAPCWADLGSEEIATLARTLTRLLGWTADTRPEMCGYTILSCDGAPVLGLGPRTAGPVSAGCTVALASDDLEAAAHRATQAGLAVLVAPMDAGPAGRTMVLALPAGQHVALWEPAAMTGFGALARPGAPCWFELVTPSVEETLTALTTLFPAETGEGPGGGRTVAIGGRPRYMLVGPGEGLELGWAVHVEVEDLDAALARVRDLGIGIEPRQTGTEGGMRYAMLRLPGQIPFWLAQQD